MIKTRVQIQDFIGHESIPEQRSLLNYTGHDVTGRPPRNHMGAITIARQIYREEGLAAFFRGLGVCSARAFVVNAVQVCVVASSGLYGVLTEVVGGL